MCSPLPPPWKFFWPNLKNQLHETTSHEIKPNFLDNFLSLPSTSQLDLDPQTAILLAPKSCTRFFGNRFFAIFCCFHFFFSETYFLALGSDLAHVWAYIDQFFMPVRGIISIDILFFFDFFKKILRFRARVCAHNRARKIKCKIKFSKLKAISKFSFQGKLGSKRAFSKRARANATTTNYEKNVFAL